MPEICRFLGICNTDKKAALVTAWAIIHHDELLKNWNGLAVGEQISKIKPLE